VNDVKKNPLLGKSTTYITRTWSLTNTEAFF
jgi:hypothetical protein